MPTITYNDAKNMTLIYLNEWLKKNPESWRDNKIVQVNFDFYSIPTIIAQIGMNTSIGQTYVIRYANSVGYTVSG